MLGGLFTFSLTGIGALLALFIKKEKVSLNNLCTGFGAGVMLAASFFSLLKPALEYATLFDINKPLSLGIGFFLGIIFLVFSELIFQKIKIKKHNNHDNINLDLQILAISVHNLPEGLAVGVAFAGISNFGLLPALLLTLGIGIQNIPEGFSVAYPLRQKGYNKPKSFFLGLMSAFSEIIGAVIGTILSSYITYILPFVLSFASGAMVFAVIFDMIPFIEKEGMKFFKWGFSIGFLVMMMLDVAF